jgi:hypothetical protein
MQFHLSRLRRGELVAGGAAVVLLLCVFLLPWYGLNSSFAAIAQRLGVSTSLNGWQSLTTLRWLMLVTILAAVALVYLQGTRRAPALPATLSLIVTLLGGLTALSLVYRVLINVPGASSVVDRKAGAFLGLVSGFAIAYGGYRSLREEGVAPQDERTDIPTIEPGERAPEQPPEAA